MVAKLPTPIISADILHHFGLLVDVKRNRLVGTTTDLTVCCIISRLSTVGTVTLRLETSRYEAILHKYPDITRPLFKHKDIKHEITHYIETLGPPVASRPLTGH